MLTTQKIVVEGASDHDLPRNLNDVQRDNSQDSQVFEVSEPFMTATFEVEQPVRAANTASDIGTELIEEYPDVRLTRLELARIILALLITFIVPYSVYLICAAHII